jgi:outer membrane protein TolC
VAGLDKSRLDVQDERDVTGQTSAGVQLLLKGGGRIAASITSNFLRYLTGSPTDTAASVLSATFTQPLLRGAGSDVVMENLTQSERDVLYALRDFTQYRKGFAVDICSAYYSVLQQRDAMRNAWFGLKNSRKSVEREQAFAQEGLSTQAALGRLKQFVLDNENRYNSAVSTYQSSLDQFKISLGLSTDARLVLNDKDLVALREKGVIHPKISAEDAIKVATVSRLDYQNDLAAADDAARKVKVAENGLKHWPRGRGEHSKPGQKPVSAARLPPHDLECRPERGPRS